MLYLIGLGLNKYGISSEGLETAKKCKKLYLETYTVDFNYGVGDLERLIGKPIALADRTLVEGCSIVDEAKKKDVALLIYGSPLTATTHITLIQEAIACGVKYKVIYAGSVFDGVAETGLQFYKFGKVASMPEWKKSFEPTSFMEIVKENQSIGAHSLILIDIGLDFDYAFKQLKKSIQIEKVKVENLVVCQNLGSKHSKIFYGSLEDFEEFNGVRKPYCIIIPEKMHFVEEEMLETYRRKG